MTLYSALYDTGKYGYSSYGTIVNDINSDAHILKSSVEETINSDASILQYSTETINSDAFILQYSTNTINSNAYILQYSTETLDSDSYIKRLNNNRSIDSNACILKPTSKNINSNAFILFGDSESILSDAYIKKIDNEETITSDAYILKPDVTGSINSDAYILQYSTKTINSDSYIIHNKVLPHGFQRSMWYDGTRYWRSNYDYANSRIIFEYSTNKVDWTENTSARITANAYNEEWGASGIEMKWADYSIEHTEDGTNYLYIVYKSGNDIKARKATTYPGTGFGWDTEQTTFDAAGDGGEYLYCNLSTRKGNKLAASATWHTGTDYRVRVNLSTAANSVANWAGALTVSSTTNANKATYNSLRNAHTQDDDVYVVWNESTALKGRFYDGDWDASVESIATLCTDIITHLRCYYGLEHARDATQTQHIVYKNANEDVCHRFNADVSVADNWSAEVIVVPVGALEHVYPCIAESGVEAGNMFIATSYNDHPTRTVEICQGHSPYTEWFCGLEFTQSSCVINLLDESPHAAAYTYQDDGSAVFTVFFQESKHLNSDAYILQYSTKTINSNAYIKKIDNEETINSNSYILKPDVTGSITSDAYIMGGDTLELNSDAYIKVIDNEETINSDAYIKVIDNEETINSDAYIVFTYEKTLDSNNYILQFSTKTINSDAYILKPANEKTINSNSYILQYSTKTIKSNAYIKISITETITSNSEIAIVGNVILISPTNSSEVLIDEGDEVIFVWRMPDTHQSTGRLDCKVQIANDSNFTEIVQEKYTIRDSGFEYYNNVTWATYPAIGVSSTYFFNNARYTTTIDPGLYYWRVRGCVR